MSAHEHEDTAESDEITFRHPPGYAILAAERDGQAVVWVEWRGERISDVNIPTLSATPPTVSTPTTDALPLSEIPDNHAAVMWADEGTFSDDETGYYCCEQSEHFESFEAMQEAADEKPSAFDADGLTTVKIDRGED